MLSAGVWKLKELTDKVTNVVMNYSEVETRVREATNDDAWGPHGTLMKEIAQYTFTYEHFPEVMGMLWKRMLHENKKNWRRVYKSLVLLSYLIKNGSERVVTSTREHIYDLRGLENYTFTDELGKDQGLNVRHKVKEMLEFIQDDDRLREERRKAKKTKEKYIGVSSDDMGMGGGGSSSYNPGSDPPSTGDRYDEEPRRFRDVSAGGGKLDEIEDWDTGRKSVVGEALDKAKDFWNRAQGKHAPDDIGENRGRYDEEDYERKARSDKDRYGNFKDDDEEFTSVERTHTTKTEKITTNRRSRKLDLGASANYGKGTESQVATEQSESAPNLFDLGEPASSGQETFADFTSFQSSGNTGDDFNPRGNTNGDFGDFAQFGNSSNAAAASSPSNGFADFSQIASTPSANSSTLPSPTAPMVANPIAPTSVPKTSSASNDLFDVFNSPNTPSMNPMQPNNMMQANSSMIGQGMAPIMPNPQVPGNLNMMAMPQGNVGIQSPMMPGMVPMTGMMQAPMMMPSKQTMNPAMMNFNSGHQKNNTWTDASSRVNISLDTLTPVGSKMQKGNMQSPSMNQMPGMAPGMSMMSPGVNNLSQGMSTMSIQNPGPNQPMVGLGQRQMVNNMGMVSNQGNMMGAPMGMQMSTSTSTQGNASFQQRTNSAFSAFGNLK